MVPYARRDDPRSARRNPFNQRQGFEIMLTLGARLRTAEGDGAERARSLVVAGADDVSDRPIRPASTSDTSTKWKIKRFSNDELRQKFVDATVASGAISGAFDSRSRHEAERDDGTLGIQRNRLERIPSRCWPATALATATGSRRGARRMTKGAWGARGPRRAYAEKRKQRAGRHKPHKKFREVMMATPETPPLWEVFIRSRNGLAPQARRLAACQRCDAGAAGRA